MLVRLRECASKILLPSVYLANMQSLPNKVDELLSRIQSQREARNCSAFCLTETWLDNNVPDAAIQPRGFSVFRSNRLKESTGKSKGGGVCFFINESWCTDTTVMEKICTANLECLVIKCRPFYLPREFSAVFLLAVYIHPRADACVASNELANIIHKHENSHPDAAFIASGDFNHCRLKSTLPNYHQHIKHPTRGDKILDHCYSNIKSAYRSFLKPPFSKSDHLSILLLPTYVQRNKLIKPTVCTIQCWSKEAEAKLHGCFDATDWSVFQSEDLEYCDAVTGYINFCTDLCVERKVVKQYSSQKPWINVDVRLKLKERAAAFKSGDVTRCKLARYSLERAIKAAKRSYGDRMEDNFRENDPRRMWQGLSLVTSYKPRHQAIAASDPGLPNNLNHFYSRFDAANK